MQTKVIREWRDSQKLQILTFVTKKKKEMMTTLCKNMTRHVGIKIQIENLSCAEEITGCDLEQNLASIKIFS